MTTIDAAPKSIVFSGNPMYFDILTTNIDAGEATEDNLSCHIQVWKVGDPDDEYISSHNPPYYKPTAIADMDVSGLIDLTPAPPVNTIFVTAHVATSMFCHFYIKHADIYGTPPEIEATLQISSNYVAIAGATRYLNDFYSGLISPNPYMLHAWYDEKGKIWFKEVRKSQPEFIYFYCNSAGDEDMVVTFYYSDGTNDVYNAATLTCEEKSVHHVKAGWNDLSLSAQVDDAKELAYYTIRIGGGAILYYQLDDEENDEDDFWLFFNGAGGMEVFRSAGFQSQENNVTRGIFERTRWKGSDFEEGFINHVLPRGQKTRTVNSGFYSRAYCEHLQQLLYGGLWYIDQDRDKYTKYLVTSSSISVYDTKDDLHFISFECQPAFNEQGFTNYQI